MEWGSNHQPFVKTLQTKLSFPTLLQFKKKWAARNQQRFLNFQLQSFGNSLYDQSFFLDVEVTRSGVALTSTSTVLPHDCFISGIFRNLSREKIKCSTTQAGSNFRAIREERVFVYGDEACIIQPWTCLGNNKKGYLDEEILSDPIYTSSGGAGLDSCVSYPTQGEAFSQELIYTASVITGAGLIFSSCHYTFPSWSQIG